MRARTPGSAGLLTQRLVALFVAGWALFDFPLLTLGFGRGTDATLFGLPRLPVLLFAGWLALIVLLAVLMECGSDGRRGGGAATDGAPQGGRAVHDTGRGGVQDGAPDRALDGAGDKVAEKVGDRAPGGVLPGSARSDGPTSARSEGATG